MAIYYVGKGGSDSNNGTTWALRKLTLTGAEALALVAGDIVYIGAGTYRETHTIAKSGSSGNTIKFIGDTTGEFTDGVGGPVRISGSDNDTTATRTNCIIATTYLYREWAALELYGCSGTVVAVSIVDNGHVLRRIKAQCVAAFNTGGGGFTLDRCVIIGGTGCFKSASGTVNILSSLFAGVSNAFSVSVGTGGALFGNNTVLFGTANNVIVTATGLTGGNVVNAVGNVFYRPTTRAFNAAANDGSLVEDYNVVHGATNSSINVAIGANSVHATFAVVLDLTDLRIPITGVTGINGGGPLLTTDDINGIPRPQGAGTDWGAAQSNRIMVPGATGTVSTARSVRDFEVPITSGVAITVSVDVSWTDTVTNKPQLKLLARYGTSEQTDTATGSGSTENLSVSATPTIPGGGKGIMIARLVDASETTNTVTFVNLEAS